MIFNQILEKQEELRKTEFVLPYGVDNQMIRKFKKLNYSTKIV